MSITKPFINKFLSLMLVLSVVITGLIPTTAVFASEVTDPGSAKSNAVLNSDGLIMNVTVPTSVLIYVDENGEVTTPDYLPIINNSVAPVYVHSLTVTPKNGWTLDPIATDYTDFKTNRKNYWLGFNGLDPSSEPIALATPIYGSDSLNLVLSADVAPQRTAINALNIGEILITMDWDAAEGAEGGTGNTPDVDFEVHSVSHGGGNMVNFSMTVESPATANFAMVPAGSTPPANGTSSFNLNSAGYQEVNVEIYDGYDDTVDYDVYVWVYDTEWNLVGPVKVLLAANGSGSGEFIPDGYTLATDADFSGTKDGEFKYIGSNSFVVVPHIIKGVSVTSYTGMFKGSYVEGVASDNPNILSMDGMFEDSQSSSLELTYFNTSGVNWMRYMFRGSQATELNLSSFDTSDVIWMGDMFNNSQATNLNLSSFNVSKVTQMSTMFMNSKATTLDLSSFDMSNLSGEAISQMFRGCSATIGYARTQADADKFNATVLKPAGLTFYLVGYEPPETPEQTGPEWVLAKDTDFNGSTNGTFTYKGTAEYVIIPDKIKYLNVTSYANMFKGTAVKGVKSTNPNVTDMTGMFENSTAESLDLSELNTSGVLYMSTMFKNSAATTIDMSNFDTSNVTTMYEMFRFSNATVLDLSSFDLSKLTGTTNMLSSAKATTGYARTTVDANKLNSVSGKPQALNFVVK